MVMHKIGVVVGLVAALGLVVVAHAGATTVSQEQASGFALTTQAPAVLASFVAPELEQPDWYRQQVANEQAAAQARAATRTGQSRTVAYSIATRGATSADLDEFAAQANQTLNDPRGWAQLGLTFVRVPSGGSFSLILSEPSQVPTFSPSCSAEWSCRVGSSVIINDMRWTGATPAWNAAGGGIRDYRHMVVNHEVGHWLGHGHYGCPAAGAYAPVMLQQSIDLQGCKFNPWPLPSELWAPNLGL